MGRPEKPVNTDDDSPGARLRRARQAAQISVSALAHRLHYSPSYLSGVENGPSSPTTKLVTRYEEALNLPSGALSLRPSESKEDMVCHIFLSGPPSVIADFSMPKARRLAAEIYPCVEHVCKALGLKLYAPPALLNPREGKRPYATIKDDERRIKGCELLMVYLGTSSALAGLHIGMAAQAKVPIVLFAEADREDEMQIFAYPDADIKDKIDFDEPAELETRLLPFLFRFFSWINLKAAAGDWTAGKRDDMERWLDEQCKMLGEHGTPVRPPISVDEWKNLRI